MDETTGTQAEKRTLYFAVLVYREEVRPRENLWFARSVLTSDVAPGETEDEAIENLKAGIVAGIRSAVSRGRSPREWYDAQPLDEPDWLAEFCRLAVPGSDPLRIQSLEGFELAHV